MESNPYEAVKLNILGTKLIADLSDKYRVKKFIFISTDKAVNPIGVMGISKRIGEKYLSFFNSKSDTTFIVTRFGNIFGSNGSVIPLFKKQIEFGCPITITDKNITRYFISKHKACHLILKLASKNNFHHNVFTFKMGEPIKIIDVIERLTSLYNTLEKQPGIKIIGLRAGEKLFEDMVSEKETLIQTDDFDILAVKDNNPQDTKHINLSELEHITPSIPNSEIKKLLVKYI